MPRSAPGFRFRAWWTLLLIAAASLTLAGGARSAGSPVWVKPVPKPVQRGELLNAQLIEASSLINVTQARLTYGVNGSGLTAAVLDTGVRTTHQDFSGRVVAQVNYTSDNGGNSGNANDGDGHGTNVTGIIAANGVHTGMAPGASIAALKVLDNNGEGSFADINSGLDWIIANRTTYNITVVNMSLGDGQNYTSYPSDAFRTKLQTLRNAGVALCAASGNDYLGFNSAQGMGYPAIFSETVSVGAVYDANVGAVTYGDGSAAFSTAADRICPFSQRLHSNVSTANRTDIFAPGGAITSAGITSDTSSSTLHGTSQAAPVVAGVVLLMQDYYQRETGALPTVTQIETWLRAGAVSINDGDDENDNVANTGLNFLRVDALAALQAAEQEIGNTYTLSGTVTESGTGLSGVTVSTGVRSATTQNDGTYTITGLSAGAYTVTPTKTGYTFSPTTRSVSVNANLSGVNFTATKTSFSISGTVRTGSGLGMSGASVTCGALSTTSDASGNYAFTGLSPNTYTVAVSRAGFNFTPSSQSVTVGPDKSGVDFTGLADQTPTYSISGTVQAGGSGLTGVTVTAGSASALTSANGTYTISGLIAGSYTVSASRSGYTLSPGSRTVVVSTNVTGIDFTATSITFSISGTVRQGASGLAGITVTAGVKSATTDNSGQYTISGLTSGAYTVAPLGSSYSFNPASASVTLSSNLTGVDFTATSATFRIGGQVTLGGVGVPGITVSVGGADVTTDGSGKYSVTGLAPGSYTIQPTTSGYQFSPSARTVTVGPDRTDTNFTAVALLQIQGRVTLDGTGIPGITVSAGTRSATTDDTGAYTIPNVPSGTYTLTPSGGGYTFDPINRSVTLSGSNVSGIDFAVVTNPHLTSLSPKVAQVTGGKSTSVTAAFDRPVTANTYIFLNSSVVQGKVPTKVLLKKGRSSVSFSLRTKSVSSTTVVTITGTANSVSRTTTVTLAPKLSSRR